MFIHEISLNAAKKDSRISWKKLLDQMAYLAALAWKNGQVQNENPTIFRRGTELVWLAETFEKISLDFRFEGSFQREAREELESWARSRLEVRLVGKNETEKHVCRCAKPAGYVLWTHAFSVGSPVECASCAGNVPLYRLPKLEGESSWMNILNWASVYRNCDSLNLDCGFGERWGERQMRDWHSGLTRLGRSLALDLERVCGVPVFYYLYEPRTRLPLPYLCPSCGNEWQKRLGGEQNWPKNPLFSFLCPACRLVSGEPF